MFDTLESRHLTDLHLSACALNKDVAPSIASFLASPRSRSVQSLVLNGNYLGAHGVKSIVDAVENSNFTITHLGLLSNDLTEDPTRTDDPVIRSEEEKRLHESILSYNIHQRLPPLLERNRVLTKRVRKAALRMLAPARIILNADVPTDAETARRAIEAVQTGQITAHFRLFDLPKEVIYTVVRHLSGDRDALSSAQLSRLIHEAEDRESILKMKRHIDIRIKKAPWGEAEKVKQNVKEDWLRRGGWDKWEVEIKE